MSLNSIPIQFTEGTDTQQLFSTQFTPAMSQFQFNSDSLTKQLDSTLLDSFLRNWVGIDSRVWINSYKSACNSAIHYAFLIYRNTVVLLTIHKNWNRSILGVVPLIYWNTVGNLTVRIWFRYQPSQRITGSIEGTTLKITKFMPLTITIVIPSSILEG